MSRLTRAAFQSNLKSLYVANSDEIPLDKHRNVDAASLNAADESLKVVKTEEGRRPRASLHMPQYHNGTMMM